MLLDLHYNSYYSFPERIHVSYIGQGIVRPSFTRLNMTERTYSYYILLAKQATNSSNRLVPILAKQPIPVHTCIIYCISFFNVTHSSKSVVQESVPLVVPILENNTNVLLFFLLFVSLLSSDTRIQCIR